MNTSCSFDKDKGGKAVKESKYRGMIDSLLYLNAYHSDTMFDVCRYTCFQANPKESHI